MKTINLSGKVLGLSLDVQQKLVFVKQWPGTKVFKYKNDTVTTLLELSNWCPRGLCHTINGDHLVGMRSLDEKRSRVVRYLGTTECQVIKNDKQGKPLFSIYSQTVLHLTENENGDICVADYVKKAVVVVDASGYLRFTYKGNIMAQLKNRLFQPSRIVNDNKLHDTSSDIVHIIDCDGHFIRYIEYPCRGAAVSILTTIWSWEN